ncbi:MAG: hypothetical protein K9I68_04310 [Bacteroidales bacterium]|nr:hypothetical protein [Bacteroidales bacterium]MCF8337779.1 hypothetical protein [Bacteroidales bacterium]
MKNLLIVSVLAMLFFTACEDDENATIDAKNYYQGYELEYSEVENKTTARAYFRKKDETGEFLPLENGAEVKVNDSLLTRDAQSLAIYYTEFSGFVDTNYYEYADKEGNMYTNEFHLSEVDEIGFLSGTGPFNLTSDYDIKWEGPPVGDNETIFFRIGYEKGEIITLKANKEGATQVYLEEKDLMQLGKGEAQMVIYRVLEQPVENTNEAGGRMHLIYSSGLVPVRIE